MTAIYNLLLLLAGLFATYSIFSHYYKNRELVFLCYGMAAASVTIAFLDPFIAILIQKIGYELIGQPFMEWGRICSISFILCGLIEFIRNSKPDFARFPQIFVAFPLLLIVTYPIVWHTLVLKDWLLGIYEISALFVGLVMHGFLSRNKKYHMTIIWGLLVLFLAYILYWLTGTAISTSGWMWKIALMAGIIILALGFPKIETTAREKGNFEMATQ